ncbi:Uncharacterized protein GBIM_01145 [Gryllus bimaculatus]|nr:Uncharacterized protein GBIM_01145 [Gryllus bimaculatus]
MPLVHIGGMMQYPTRGNFEEPKNFVQNNSSKAIRVVALLHADVPAAFIDDAVMYYQQKYDLEKKGDRYFLKFPDSSATFNCSKAHFTMENLFNGDKQLGNTLNNFLNENWRAVVDDLGQPFVDASAQVIRQFTYTIVGDVPYDDIFDDVELPH